MNLDRMKNSGMVSVVLSYVIWGFFPLYWHLLAGLSSTFVLCNRLLWALPFALLMLFFQKRLGELRSVLRDWATMKKLILSSVIMTFSWGLYIYAIASGHTLDASLGYYINPLMVFIVSLVFYKEKGTPAQVAALCLTIVGVVLSLLRYGTFPIFSLLLPLVFTAYSVVKKQIFVDAVVGVAVECLVMVPFAIAFMLIFQMDIIRSLSGSQIIFLLLSGAVTAVPLMLFSHGVNKAPFVSISMVMYISPTLVLICGLLTGETLTPEKILPFVFTLVALVIYSADLIVRERKKKSAILSKQTP